MLGINKISKKIILNLRWKNLNEETDTKAQVKLDLDIRYRFVGHLMKHVYTNDLNWIYYIGHDSWGIICILIWDSL